MFDFHMHSLYSMDGEKTVDELFSIAVSKGLKYIAVSDHNTIEALPEACEKAERYGLCLIPAVELDTLMKGENFHILAYGIDIQNKEIPEVWKETCRKEREICKERIRLINKAGISIDEDEAIKRAARGIFVTGELLGEMALSDPDQKDNPLLLPYREGGSRSENPCLNFYWDWCAPGKPAYVCLEYISAKKAVEIIKSAGGIPVLAHPGQSLTGDVKLEEILSLGVEGIECFSSYHSPRQNEYYFHLAKQKSLLISCGSDYHGKTKPAVKMGEYGLDDAELKKEILEAFLDALVR